MYGFLATITGHVKTLLAALIVCFFGLIVLVVYLLKPSAENRDETESSNEPVEHEKSTREKLRGKGKRRFIKREIRAMEIEEKKKKKAEKKEELKKERSKVQKTSKFVNSSEKIQEKNGRSSGGAPPVVRSIPRKRS